MIGGIMRGSVCHRLMEGRLLILNEIRVICKAGLAPLSSSNLAIVVYQDTWLAENSKGYVFGNGTANTIYPTNFGALTSCYNTYIVVDY
jgi:hypothetical protein